VESEEAARRVEVAEGVKERGKKGGEKRGSTEIGSGGGRGYGDAVECGVWGKVKVPDQAERGRWERAEEGVEGGVEEGGPGCGAMAGEVAVDEVKAVAGPG